MKKRKIKWKTILIIILFLICITALSISIINIIKWKLDGNNIKKQVEKIEEIVEIEEVIENEKIEIVEPTEEIEEANPYWDYINMPLINVNFTNLKAINPDTVGWISVNGTNINYPFVKTNNNEFYLTHSFDKNYNSAGWVFMDYRNNITTFDNNTIIYAHGRLDTTMFGSLKNILNSGWTNNTNNYVIKLSTEYENTLWQVFSVYKIPTTSDYLQTVFTNEKEKETFFNMLLKRSNFNFNTTVLGTDKIITLSTCLNDKEKVVLHAKLIKIEKK